MFAALPDELNEFYAHFEALSVDQREAVTKVTEHCAHCNKTGRAQGTEEDKPTEDSWPRQHPRASSQGLLLGAG